jgi:FKBP-type peptidyl-prolyl cis-trans isomerase
VSQKASRFVLLLIAGLFIVSTFAGVASVFINNNPSDTNNDQTTNKERDNLNKLQGTQLANFTPVEKVESLQKIDLTPGTGVEAKPNSTVTVHYTGAIAATGVIFESSLDSGQPIPLSLNQVIKGWTDGVPGMKVGGTRRLLIPAAQAYGAQASATIPANSDLVFDITLVDAK